MSSSCTKDRDAIADSRFSCSVNERACFEAGIKMATIYHQFVGTPVSGDTVTQLEDSMAAAISVQPYVISAEVHIDRSVFPADEDRFSYISLTGDMIDAVVHVKVGGTVVIAEMRYDTEMGYPLMYISSVFEES
ncbi:MAG: dihydroneopterin aldolase family protein [Candidatus Methanomethylophilaceae archaeon]|nr:dihydroneopterin aldolase family protein [Candidatus Methanomethylophilaceae archaeon]